MTSHDELAHLLFITDNRHAADVEQEWLDATTGHRMAYYVMAKAVITAGYKRTE